MEIKRTDVNEVFVHHIAERHLNWGNGGGAASYAAGLVVIWDSHDYPIVVEACNAVEREEIMDELDVLPPHQWSWEWNRLCDYPDDPISPDNFTYLCDLLENAPE